MSENKNAKTLADNGQPVAHVYLVDKAGRPLVAWDNAKDIQLGDKLYAAPKQWVGLTNKDIDDCYFAARQPDFDIWDFAAEIEEVLKQKNMG